MPTLKKLQSILTRKGSLLALLTTNWKAKLACLVLAILVWVWVTYSNGRDSSQEWDMDEVRLSVPEFN